jgi:hypothetical protein
VVRGRGRRRRLLTVCKALLFRFYCSRPWPATAWAARACRSAALPVKAPHDGVRVTA